MITKKHIREIESLLNKASINIAVKNRLNEGINKGYQSFWNKIYKLELPLTLTVKPMPRNIEPIILLTKR